MHYVASLRQLRNLVHGYSFLNYQHQSKTVQSSACCSVTVTITDVITVYSNFIKLLREDNKTFTNAHELSFFLNLQIVKTR